MGAIGSTQWGSMECTVDAHASGDGDEASMSERVGDGRGSPVDDVTRVEPRIDRFGPDQPAKQQPGRYQQDQTESKLRDDQQIDIVVRLHVIHGQSAGDGYHPYVRQGPDEEGVESGALPEPGGMQPALPARGNRACLAAGVEKLAVAL